MDESGGEDRGEEEKEVAAAAAAMAGRVSVCKRFL